MGGSRRGSALGPWRLVLRRRSGLCRGLCLVVLFRGGAPRPGSPPSLSSLIFALLRAHGSPQASPGVLRLPLLSGSLRSGLRCVGVQRPGAGLREWLAACLPVLSLWRGLRGSWRPGGADRALGRGWHSLGAGAPGLRARSPSLVLRVRRSRPDPETACALNPALRSSHVAHSRMRPPSPLPMPVRPGAPRHSGWFLADGSASACPARCGGFSSRAFRSGDPGPS